MADSISNARDGVTTAIALVTILMGDLPDPETAFHEAVAELSPAVAEGVILLLAGIVAKCAKPEAWREAALRVAKEVL